MNIFEETNQKLLLSMSNVVKAMTIANQELTRCIKLIEKCNKELAGMPKREIAANSRVDDGVRWSLDVRGKPVKYYDVSRFEYLPVPGERKAAKVYKFRLKEKV